MARALLGSSSMWGPHTPSRFAWTRAQAVWVAAFVVAMSFVPLRCVPDVPPRDASRDPRPPGTWILYGDVLEANDADAADFEVLPGIGPALAARLVAERARRGGFCDVQDVAEAAKLSEARWREIAPQLRVSPSRRCPSSSNG